ncbi:hypothetical protein PYV50_14940 [Pseudomonas sp. H22_DOA]|nr:hypothetical protein PYV50_14940 [Pseudomonas sp. H22_DOA]
MERLRIERQLDQLIRELENGDTHSGQPLPEQLHDLPTLRSWPTDRYIEVTDAEGVVSATYPSNAPHDAALRVVVSQAQLQEGRLLETVIKGLPPKRLKPCSGPRSASDASERHWRRRWGRVSRLIVVGFSTACINATTRVTLTK